jgi:hypothetical protein
LYGGLIRKLSENPRALKGYSKEGLPVVWRSNKKAWITASLFESYFASELHHELKAAKHLTTKQLVAFFKHTDIATGIIDDNDANRERSVKVARGIESALACYKELFWERHEAACQLSLHHFFKRVESCESTDSEPSTSAGEPAQPDLAPPPSASSESSD